MATDTDPWASVQRRTTRLEKALENVCRSAGISVEAAMYLADGPPDLTPAEERYAQTIVPDADYVTTLESTNAELQDKVSDLTKIVAKGFSNGIVIRGSAYEAALKDVNYKECPTCKERCIPMCALCDASSWEKTAQAYFDAMAEAEDWRRGAEGALVTSLPPRTGAHTEMSSLEHKKRYTESKELNGTYAAGADAVTAVILKLKGDSL